MALRSISVCSGVGALDLAVELGADACGLGPVEPLLYIERELPAAAILASRCEDGSLPAAPIWSDLATCDGSRYRGLADIVIAGLPCQPYSVAGKRRGHDDERAIWPSFFGLLDGCGAPLVFLENVAGFVKFWPPVREQLRERGYRVVGPLVLAALDVGASHQRKRMFVLAYRAPGGRGELRESSGSGGLADGGHEPVDDATGPRSGRREPGEDQTHGDAAWLRQSGGRRDAVAHAGCPGSVADTIEQGREKPKQAGIWQLPAEAGHGMDYRSQRCIGLLDNSRLAGLEERRGEPGDSGSKCAPTERGGDELEDSKYQGPPCSRATGQSSTETNDSRGSIEYMGLFAPGPGDPTWPAIISANPLIAPAVSHFEAFRAGLVAAGLLDHAALGCSPAEIGHRLAKAASSEKAQRIICRVADGVARWIDGRTARLRACGNGVVALQGAAAFALLAVAAGLGDGARAG